MEIVRRYKLEGARRYYKNEYSDKLNHIDLNGWPFPCQGKMLIEVFSEKDHTKKDLRKFDLNAWYDTINEYKAYTPFIVKVWEQRDLNDIMTEEVYLSENKTNDIWSNL